MMRRAWVILALLLTAGSEPPKPPPDVEVIPAFGTEPEPAPVEPELPPIIPEYEAFIFEGRAVEYYHALVKNQEMLIFLHRGGYIGIQEIANQHHIDTGKTAHVPGYCISACTMMLSIPDLFTWSCGAQFGFHAASIPGPNPGERVIHKGATLDLMDNYPDPLFVELNNGAMDRLEITYLTGRRVSELTGVPCQSAKP